MRVGCNNYGLGTWFQLRRICSVMMFPEHPMTCLDRFYIIVWEVLCRALLRIWGPKLVLYEGSKKGLGRWGRSIGPEPRAHMGLGISEPYSSHFLFLHHCTRCEFSFFFFRLYTLGYSLIFFFMIFSSLYRGLLVLSQSHQIFCNTILNANFLFLCG